MAIHVLVAKELALHRLDMLRFSLARRQRRFCFTPSPCASAGFFSRRKPRKLSARASHSPLSPSDDPMALLFEKNTQYSCGHVYLDASHPRSSQIGPEPRLRSEATAHSEARAGDRRPAKGSCGAAKGEVWFLV